MHALLGIIPYIIYKLQTEEIRVISDFTLKTKLEIKQMNLLFNNKPFFLMLLTYRADIFVISLSLFLTNLLTLSSSHTFFSAGFVFNMIYLFS